MQVDFHPSATDELEQSADWYAERSESTAARFADAVDAALKKIVANPTRFPSIQKSYQACSVERFPFQIVFRHDGTRIYVVAVAHAKRRPGYWKRRTK